MANLPCKDLTEDDVPGASLNGRRPEQLKVPELKLWLACRAAPTRGKKAVLVERQVLMHVLVIAVLRHTEGEGSAAELEVDTDS